MADETRHVLRITADTSQADDALEQSAERLDNIDDSAQRVNRTFASFGSRLAGAFKNSGIADFGRRLADTARNADFGDRLVSSVREANVLGKALRGLRLPSGAMSDEAASLRDEIAEIEQAMADLAGKQIPTGAYAGVSKDLDKINAKIEGYIAKQEKLKALNSIEDTREWKDLAAQIDVATEAADRLWQQKRQLEQSGGMYDRSYQETAEYLREAETQLAAMKQRQDELRASGRTMSDEWQRISIAVTTAEAKVETYKSQMAIAREAGTAYTAEYSDMVEKVDKASEAVDRLYAEQQRLAETGSVENSRQWKSLQYDIDQARARAEQYNNTMASMRSDGTAFQAGVDTSEYAALEDRLGSVRSQLSSIQPTGVSVFRSVASAAGSAAKNIAASFGSKVLGGVKKLGSGLLGLVKNFASTRKAAKQTDNVIGKAYKTFMGFFTMIKSRAKEAIITTVWQTMQDSIGDIAGVADRFNSGLSGMIDSLKAFGAQLVAIAEPIISVVTPAISALIDTLTAGADKLAQFTARLTGQDTYVKAAKGQSNYAASVQDTEKSTKKADEAAKKYKRTLLGFDQINRMDGQDAESDAGDIVGIDDAQLSMAETRVSKLNSLADKIYSAFKAKDFKAAGAAVGEGINAAFSWLKNAAGWEANSSKITSALSGVIDFINGLSSSFDGVSIGNAIGDVVNTVIHSVAQLVDPNSGIDFKLIGKNIGDTVKSAIDTIDWTTAGEAFVNSIQGLISFINGIIGTDGIFSSVGTAIADGLRGAVDAFDPQLIGESLANLVNGIADFTIGLFDDPSVFADFGAKFAESINTAISNIDAEKVITAIESFCVSVFNFLYNTITNLDWGALGNLLWDVLSGLASDAWNGIVNWFEGEKLDINYNASGSSVSHSGRRSAVTYAGAFASGGIIGDGQLFLANEDGAELIGSDGRGNTAVVNNNQIISAVVSGVRQAMMEVMMTMTKGNDSDGGDIVLMVDSEELARATIKGQRKIDKRYNPGVSFA